MSKGGDAPPPIRKPRLDSTSGRGLFVLLPEARWLLVLVLVLVQDIRSVHRLVVVYIVASLPAPVVRLNVGSNGEDHRYRQQEITTQS